jgi:hypothetical protein
MIPAWCTSASNSVASMACVTIRSCWKRGWPSRALIGKSNHARASNLTCIRPNAALHHITTFGSFVYQKEELHATPATSRIVSRKLQEPDDTPFVAAMECRCEIQCGCNIYSSTCSEETRDKEFSRCVVDLSGAPAAYHSTSGHKLYPHCRIDSV